MSRFDAREVAVKGGFGVRTLVSPSPYTADIDMLIDKPELQGMNQDKAYQVCTAYVLENLMAEGEDHFHFQPTGAAQIIGLRADHAVAKIYVQVAVGDGSFTSIQIDAGMKPQGVPVQQVSGRDVLGFADIPNPDITTASREYIAGDKISLFLETGMERPRDLVHAALLLEEGKYDPGALGNWIEKLARYRGVEGKLLSDLPEPVGEWLGQVEQICKRYGLPLSAQDCYDRVNVVLERLVGRERGRGSPERPAGERQDGQAGDRAGQDVRHDAGPEPKQPKVREGRGQSSRGELKGKSFVEAVREESDKRVVPGSGPGQREISGREFVQLVHEKPISPGSRQQGAGRGQGIDRGAGSSPAEGSGSSGVDRGAQGSRTPGMERGSGYGGIEHGGTER